MRFPQLVSQIHADYSGIVSVSYSKGFGTLEEHIFWILSAPPEPIAIIVGATPLGGRGVVVENDHQTHISEGADRYVEDFHTCFPYKFRVGS